MIAMQADGRLVVGASDGEAAVVTRVLADGQPDPNFLRGTGLEDRLGYIISALAVGPDDSIVIALGLSDFGYHGLEIKRLLPSGELDESFGNAGSTKIDMPSEFGSVSLLFDMLVREEGLIVGAGGNPFARPSHGPIIVRLLGAGAGDSPGVLSFTPGWLRMDEDLADVSVEVRRTGGDAGHVSVAYQVFADDDASAASVGEDFVADAGRLEWEDGDATNRQIRVRIIDDDLPEDSERITVLLTDPEGGVGLGKAGQIVDILPNDGAEDDPGQLGFTSNGYRVDEENEDGGVIVRVSRTDGSTGAVGVNYSTTDGTATAGTDFTARSGTLNWADGDSDVKSIYISTRSDSRYEGNETFQIQLSDATGGAALGSLSTATVTIIDNDGGRASDNGGGGTLDRLLVLLLIGLAFGPQLRVRYTDTRDFSTTATEHIVGLHRDRPDAPKKNDR